ncbi:MAG TPA: group 1 truncated hemoglobin [Planctomycetota bacterium]|nr:group 1 truncated hemoglobin [Planctomycetota bacterium]
MDTHESSRIFERIGGQQVVAAVVDELYRRVLRDPALAPKFADVDMQQLRNHQVAFLAMALGGEPVYAGRSMEQAHRGLGITRRQFAGVAAHLHQALRGIVPEAEIEQILVTVASLQDQVVEH